MKILEMADLVRFRTMTTQELRETFLISNLFQPGEISFYYVDLDRTVIGSAVPLGEPLELATYDALRANYFTERREIGVLNVGGAGTVQVQDVTYELDKFGALYIGRGNDKVVFASKNASAPAEFYLLSYPSHAVHPTSPIRASELQSDTLGSQETANLREITRLIHLKGVRSSQLVMGFTRLQPGSVWNTMPAHTHMRRSEVYFYFDMDADQRVIHLMGPGDETRNLVVANKQVAISPGWSIHSGVGTKNYAFCWGMGGENQEYSDMDAVATAELR